MPPKRMPDEYGLIGYPLLRTFSPVYFTGKFAREGIEATYAAFPLKEIDQLPALLKAHPDLRGFNITIPYKTSILPFLQDMDKDVAEMGACNCVKITDSGLVGYNTDWLGFRDSLKPLLHGHHTHALVLGNGGAAKAVVFALRKMGIAYTVASRAAGQGAVALNSITADDIESFQVIINTTPLGMYPDIDEAPAIPYEALTPRHLLYDLVYNPEETLFLKKGEAAGAIVKNGKEMVVLQAELSWKIWNDQATV